LEEFLHVVVIGLGIVKVQGAKVVIKMQSANDYAIFQDAAIG
jgi:hypothetical protein